MTGGEWGSTRGIFSEIGLLRSLFSWSGYCSGSIRGDVPVEKEASADSSSSKPADAAPHPSCQEWLTLFEIDSYTCASEQAFQGAKK
jgi:hypothetical protein